MSVFAVVPVKDLRETKSRLSPALGPGARAGLTLYMMGRVLTSLRGAGIGNVLVVSPDRLVLEEAGKRGAEPLLQKEPGLNPALEQGRRWAVSRGASALLVLPADLPLVEAPDVRAVLDRAGGDRLAVISPDGGDEGTNALLLKPPDAIPFLFGPGSFEAHRDAARGRGVETRICTRRHLSFDLDTRRDLDRLAAPEGLRP